MCSLQSELTPSMVEQIVNICNQIVDGSQITKDDIEIIEFERGLVNNIYRVILTKGNRWNQSVQNDIVVKLFESDPSKSLYDPFYSIINSVIVGQFGLGPKVLLVRNDAIVMEYFHGRTSSYKDDHHVVFRLDIAKMLARFHHLPVPGIHNEQRSNLRLLVFEWLNDNNSMMDSLRSGELKRILAANVATLTLTADRLFAEEEYIYQSIVNAEHHYPIVFSHQDFNHSNILVKIQEEEDCNDSVGGKNFQIRFVDFDFSKYFYRGYDLGRYVIECRQKFTKYDANKVLTSDELEQFLATYLEECARLHDCDSSSSSSYWADKRNTIEHLLKEVKLFLLFAHLTNIKFYMWCSMRDHTIAAEYMANSNSTFKRYLCLKEQFISEGSFPLSLDDDEDAC